ncbi:MULTISPECIES: thaumatin family protein [Thiorhodovibrio]|uniref:thaumatin family protein n=1 Tax=Thiorhodovibrio TaxID=61593 RepID=UPI001914334A|nr:thaumatin family protein [Thiorhodovibrio litoralis]WPL11479.1 Thaumatin family protein [Thiorhodovibrio litoralis]
MFKNLLQKTQLPASSASAVAFSIYCVLAPAATLANDIPLDIAATSKIAILFPVLGQGQLSSDIYVYGCGDDATCTAKTQLADYGHVTNVQRWPKNLDGPGGTPPAVWMFPSIIENLPQYFEFWQQSGSTWQSCILGVTPDGGLDDTVTTCAGVVPTAPQTSNGIAQFSMGAAMFAQATNQADPMPSQVNTLPARGISFTNATSSPKVCLQTDSSFNHLKCAGGEAHAIAQTSSYAIDSETLKDGSNSGAAQVMAYQFNQQGRLRWVYTGRDASARVYATKMEWTVWPEHADYTPGPTTIDISLVDGFNFGVELVPNTDTVCSVADTEGGVPYFVMYPAGTSIAKFPLNSNTTLDQACPAPQQTTDSLGGQTGCYSACTYANVTNQQIDETCCISPFHSPTSCTLPPTTDYVQDIDATSLGVYSWAFQDYRGTFTCEATANLTFRLLDPPDAAGTTF